MSAGRTLFCSILLVAGVAAVAPGLDRLQPAPAPSDAPAAAAVVAAPPAVGNGYARREVARAPDGHFYAEAQVNGAQVRFLIDTGASFVVLSPADARRAGIVAAVPPRQAMAAGGPVDYVPVTIDRLALGPLAATAVEGAVVEDLPVSLLGQSFLARVGSVRIEGDRMVLR